MYLNYLLRNDVLRSLLESFCVKIKPPGKDDIIRFF